MINVAAWGFSWILPLVLFSVQAQASISDIVLQQRYQKCKSNAEAQVSLTIHAATESIGGIREISLPSSVDVGNGLIVTFNSTEILAFSLDPDLNKIIFGKQLRISRNGILKVKYWPESVVSKLSSFFSPIFHRGGDCIFDATQAVLVYQILWNTLLKIGADSFDTSAETISREDWRKKYRYAVKMTGNILNFKLFIAAQIAIPIKGAAEQIIETNNDLKVSINVENPETAKIALQLIEILEDGEDSDFRDRLNELISKINININF